MVFRLGVKTDLIIAFWQNTFNNLDDVEKIKKLYFKYSQISLKFTDSNYLFETVIGMIFKDYCKSNPSDLLMPQKKPEFELFFQISLFLEETNLQKIIQYILHHFEYSSFNIDQFCDNTNFLSWLIALL